MATLICAVPVFADDMEDFLNSGSGITWQKITDTTGCSWSGNNTLSNIIYSAPNSKLQSASGVLKLTSGSDLSYYLFTYSNPYSSSSPSSHLDNLSANISNAYFYNISSGNVGAIYNTSKNNYSISADFIGNTAGNVGGAIANYASTIDSIQGDFIGNTASNYHGGAIRNRGTIGLVANTKNVVFNDNKDSSGYNDIYQNNGTLVKIVNSAIERMDLTPLLSKDKGGGTVYHSMMMLKVSLDK